MPMLACLAYELELRNHPPRATDPVCKHTPDDVYTREPCSCGREVWPPRGRGRGESLYSPRRVAAKLKAVEAEKLRMQGWTYQAIARALGYQTPSGVWHALQRLRDYRAAWVNYEHRTGRRRFERSVDAAREYVATQAAEAATETLREELSRATPAERLAIVDAYLTRLSGEPEEPEEPEEP